LFCLWFNYWYFIFDIFSEIQIPRVKANDQHQCFLCDYSSKISNLKSHLTSQGKKGPWYPGLKTVISKIKYNIKYQICKKMLRFRVLNLAPYIWWFWRFLKTFPCANRVHTLGFCSTQGYYKTMKYGARSAHGKIFKNDQNNQNRLCPLLSHTARITLSWSIIDNSYFTSGWSNESPSKATRLFTPAQFNPD